MRNTNITKNQLQLKENSAHDTNVTNIQLKIKQKNGKDTNVTHNQLEQTVKQNSKETMPKTLR